QHASRFRLAVRRHLARPIRRFKSWAESFRRSGSTPPAATNRDQTRFDAQQIAESVESSLRSLRIDYIDVLHMHSCKYGDLNDELLRLLENLRRGGKVRHLGLATSASECRQIIVRYPQFRVLQFRDNLWEFDPKVFQGLAGPA